MHSVPSSAEITANGEIHTLFDEMRRSSAAPSDTIRFLLPLAFLRWLTAKKQGSVEVNIAEGLYIELPAELEFTTLMLQVDSPDLGESANRIFETLEALNPRELAGVFEHLDFSHPLRRDQYLRQAIVRIGNMKVQQSDGAVLNLVDNFLDVTLTGTGNGHIDWFTTPDSICALIAEITALGEGESIYDPVCGSARLLLACATHAKGMGHGQVRLAGGEINHDLWALAKLNLISHGYSSDKLLNADSLSPAGVHVNGDLQQKFEVVVAHPPWGMRYRCHDELGRDDFGRFRLGIPPKNNADYAFVLHVASSLAAGNGRGAVVISHGALTRAGAERQIRQALIEENIVDAVIGLPEKVFSGTTIAGAILILRNSRSDGGVLFIDSRESATYGRSRNFLSPEAIAQLVDTYRQRRTTNGVSRTVSVSEIAANDFSFSIPLYLNSPEDEPPRAPETVRAERLAIEQELAHISSKIDSVLQQLSQ